MGGAKTAVAVAATTMATMATTATAATAATVTARQRRRRRRRHGDGDNNAPETTEHAPAHPTASMARYMTSCHLSPVASVKVVSWASKVVP